MTDYINIYCNTLDDTIIAVWKENGEIILGVKLSRCHSGVVKVLTTIDSFTRFCNTAVLTRTVINSKFSIQHTVLTS